MRSRNGRGWVLAALVFAVLMNALDVTIVNVALPTIATKLSAGTGAQQWVVNSYLLVFAGMMLPAGALGDRYGRKRLLLIGLALFGAGSLAAAWSGAVGVLVAARAAMGLGAAIIVPTVLAVLAVLFHEQERARAVSWVVIGISAGVPLGPIVSGYFLGHFWWGSIFLINVPVMVLALVAIGILLAESRDPNPGQADVAGGLLSVAGLVVLVYGVIEAPRRGWADLLVLTALGLAGVLLAAFVVWELRAPQAMIDLRLFARAQFAWGTVGLALTSFVLFGLLFTLPQYLQFVSGYKAFGTGMHLLPLVVGIILGAPAGSRLAARFGYRTPVAGGLLLAASGLAAGATTGISGGYGFVAGWLILAGLGIGIGLSPATDAVLGVLPPQRSGSGSAITQALRQAAGALGVALLGSLLSHGYAARIVTRGLPAAAAGVARGSIAGALAVANRLRDPVLAASAKAAFIHGMAVALSAWAAVALLGAALTAAFLPGRPRTDTEQRSEEALRARTCESARGLSPGTDVHEGDPQPIHGTAPGWSAAGRRNDE